MKATPAFIASLVGYATGTKNPRTGNSLSNIDITIKIGVDCIISHVLGIKIRQGSRVRFIALLSGQTDASYHDENPRDSMKATCSQPVCT